MLCWIRTLSFVLICSALRVDGAAGNKNFTALNRSLPPKCSFEFDLMNEPVPVPPQWQQPDSTKATKYRGDENVTLLVGLGFLKTGTTRLSHCLRQLSSRSFPAAAIGTSTLDDPTATATTKHQRAGSRTWCSPPVKEARFWHSQAVAPCVHPAGWVPAVDDGEARPVCGTEWLQALRQQYLEKLLGVVSTSESTQDEDGGGDDDGTTTGRAGSGELRERARWCDVAWEFSPGTLQATASTLCALRLLRHLFPTAVVVVSLRDPVSRAHSQQNMWYQRRCLKTASPLVRLPAAGGDFDHRTRNLGDQTRHAQVQQGQASFSHPLPRCAELTANVQLQHELEFLQTAAPCSKLRKLTTGERVGGGEARAPRAASEFRLHGASDAAFDALSQCGFALAQSIADHPALKGTCRAFPRPLAEGLAPGTAAESSSANRTQEEEEEEDLLLDGRLELLPNCPAPVLIQSHYSVFLNLLLSIFGTRHIAIVQGAASSAAQSGQGSTSELRRRRRRRLGASSSVGAGGGASRFARSFSNLVKLAEARGNNSTTKPVVVEHAQEQQQALLHCVHSGSIGASAYINNSLSSELRQALVRVSLW